MPQPADRGEQLARPVPLAAGVEGDRELARLRDRHPRLVADAADAEARHHERVPAAGDPLGGGPAAQGAAEHRVVPVHREPALVRERLRVPGDDVAELVGRELPVRLRLPGEPGDRDRAAQPVQDARAPGQQRERARPARGVPLPRHLAARRLQVEHPARSPARTVGHMRSANLRSPVTRYSCQAPTAT